LLKRSFVVSDHN